MPVMPEDLIDMLDGVVYILGVVQIIHTYVVTYAFEDLTYPIYYSPSSILGWPEFLVPHENAC